MPQEFTQDQQFEAAERVVKKLKLSEEVSMQEFIAALPVIVATIYSENRSEDLLATFEAMKNSALLIHTALAMDRTHEKIQKNIGVSG